MKMQISFLIEKNSDLHLMKMQIKFWLKKKKFKSVSNEDANQFFWLRKIQICI